MFPFIKVQLFPVLLAAFAALGLPASAQVSVYVSQHDVESAEESGIAGVTPSQIFTETFSGLAAGAKGNNLVNGYVSPTIGVTYTSSSGGSILVNDQYGGYGEGNYLGLASGTSTTMTLSTPAQYFGFYFTAGDANNRVLIYSGNTLLLNFSTSTLINMLPKTVGTTITAINGSKYQTMYYYGQPVSNFNSSEPYAYLHFVTTGATVFDRIVLQQATSSAIFENDNHSILTAKPVIPGSLVVVPVPEPFSLGLVCLASCLLLRRRR